MLEIAVLGVVLRRSIVSVAAPTHNVTSGPRQVSVRQDKSVKCNNEGKDLETSFTILVDDGQHNNYSREVLDTTEELLTRPKMWHAV